MADRRLLELIIWKMECERRIDCNEEIIIFDYDDTEESNEN